MRSVAGTAEPGVRQEREEATNGPVPVAPGARLLNISPDAYHADPGETPTLNASVAKKLVLETPAHAKQAHPRLADGWVQTHTDAMDEGTALHQMLLGDDRVSVLPYDSFRTADAKMHRGSVRAQGRVPMLQSKWDEILVVGDALKQQVAAFPIDPPLFVNGMAEQTIMWEENGVGLRARLDWLASDFTVIDDLKKARSADKRGFQKSLFALGYDIQAAFYIRAVKAAFGVTPVFRWVAIEPDRPYAMSVHTLSAQALSAAHAKVDLAIELWAECLETGVWPAYPRTVQVVELPAWMDAAEWDDSALTEVPF